MIRLCTKCGKEEDHNKGQTQCKKCYKEWYSKYSKEGKRDKHYQRKFNITLEDYNKLLDKYNGVCHSCMKPEEGRTKSLAVDHCHTTGEIRGLLCQKCNRGIGLLGDSVEGVREALVYLVKHYSPQDYKIISKYKQEYIHESKD